MPNIQRALSVADIIFTDLHHLASFHICYISVADMKMRPNSYMWQIFVTDILQIFHRTDMCICSISASLVILFIICTRVGYKNRKKNIE